MTYRSEYRINKKGSECFRTDDYTQAMAKLDELNAKRPIHTMQTRMCQTNRVGALATDLSGRALWSAWMEVSA